MHIHSLLLERKKSVLYLLGLSFVVITLLIPTMFASATSIGTNVSVTGTFTVTDTSTFTGAVTFNGNITIGNATTTDIVYLNARIASSIEPTANDSEDIGAYDNAWNNIYVSSTAFLNAVSVDGNFNPTTNNARDIGAYGTAFRSAYVSTTLFVGGAGTQVSLDNNSLDSEGTFTLQTTLGNTALTLISAGSGDIVLNPGGNIRIASGQLENTTYADSNGDKVFTLEGTWTTGNAGMLIQGSNAQILASSQVNEAFSVKQGWSQVSSANSGSKTWIHGVAQVIGDNTQNWTNTVGLRVFESDITTFGSGTGAITGAAGFYFNDASVSGATITNLYGIYIEEPTTGGTLNDAIHVVAGRTFLGGPAYLSTVTSTMIEPRANNTSDLGSYGKAWKSFYASSTAYIGGATGDQLMVGTSSAFIVKEGGRVGIASTTPSADLAVGSGASVTSSFDFGTACFRMSTQNGSTDEEVYYWPCVGAGCPTVAMAAAGWATSTASCF